MDFLCCRKWAKSTLVLVPLFGVHYMALIGLSYYVGEDPVIEVIWLFADQLFASFQVHFPPVFRSFLLCNVVVDGVTLAFTR